jgi:hypothetical protein
LPRATARSCAAACLVFRAALDLGSSNVLDIALLPGTHHAVRC